MIKFVSWSGTIVSVVASFVMAFGFLKYAFIFFIVGSGAWFFVGIVKRDAALYSLNGVFLCADLVGVYRTMV